MLMNDMNSAEKNYLFLINEVYQILIYDMTFYQKGDYKEVFKKDLTPIIGEGLGIE